MRTVAGSSLGSGSRRFVLLVHRQHSVPAYFAHSTAPSAQPWVVRIRLGRIKDCCMNLRHDQCMVLLVNSKHMADGSFEAKDAGPCMGAQIREQIG